MFYSIQCTRLNLTNIIRIEVQIRDEKKIDKTISRMSASINQGTCSLLIVTALLLSYL